MYSGETDSFWSKKGATLSDKSARKEFGLTQEEIQARVSPGQRRIEAIKSPSDYPGTKKS
jgi:hypothetical protein